MNWLVRTTEKRVFTARYELNLHIQLRLILFIQGLSFLVFFFIFGIIFLFLNFHKSALEMACFCQEMQHVELPANIVLLFHVTVSFFKNFRSCIETFAVNLNL